MNRYDIERAIFGDSVFNMDDLLGRRMVIDQRTDREVKYGSYYLDVIDDNGFMLSDEILRLLQSDVLGMPYLVPFGSSRG
jgi:hypothetical protein